MGDRITVRSRIVSGSNDHGRRMCALPSYRASRSSLTAPPPSLHTPPPPTAVRRRQIGPRHGRGIPRVIFFALASLVTKQRAVMLCDSHSPCLNATALEILAGNATSRLQTPVSSYSWDRRHDWPQNGIRETSFSGLEGTASVWPRPAFD